MPETTKTQPLIFVATGNSTGVLKVVGRANFTSSVPFKAVINELRQRGVRLFILDLTECVTMDSTFLGVLAGFVLHGNEQAASEHKIELQLLNPNQRVSDLLENLGVAHMFKLCANGKPVGDLLPVSEPDPATKEELNRTCLEAHQVLMQLNPANIPKFKEVTQFLAEDLKRGKSD